MSAPRHAEILVNGSEVDALRRTGIVVVLPHGHDALKTAANLANALDLPFPSAWTDGTGTTTLIYREEDAGQ